MNKLVSDEVPEDYNLEYKAELDLNNADHKRKLLKTISAFANTSGGLLIYGVTEKDQEKGIPGDLIGFDWDNIDENLQTVTSIIRDRSERPITIFEPHCFRLGGSEKVVLLIKVPKSWNGPHRVKLNGKKEFYTRIKNKSEPMNIEELRISFNISETLIERIKDFRENRISELYINNTPVPFEGGVKLLIHLVPLNAFNPGQIIDIPLNNELLRNITVMGSLGSIGFNLDGLIAMTDNYIEPSYSYVQLFRNGILEIVYGHEIDDETEIKHISAIYDEKEIVRTISKNLEMLSILGVEVPIFIFISLINVRDFQMATRGRNPRRSPRIYRDIVTLPEVLLESYDVNVPEVLKKSFDMVWNAFGQPESINYAENGEWKHKGI